MRRLVLTTSLLAALPIATSRAWADDAPDSSIEVEQGDDDDADEASAVHAAPLAKHAAHGKASGGAQSPASRDAPSQAREADRLRTDSSTHVRRFHEVLDELLAEFGYDVKMGQIKGLSNLAIRQVKVSRAIPRTYEDYMETLLQERIRENSQVKLISCVPCKTRTSSLVDGKLLISSPATNLARLETAASQLGIENFMDAVLIYHTTHMVLALSVFNSQTKELVWARTYNSETLKSRYQKLAVDYSQVAASRAGDEYVPEYRVLFGAGGAGMPNVAGTAKDSTMLNVQIRATEKFDSRRSEFGMLLSVLKTTSSVFKEYPSDKPATAPGDTGPTTQDKVTKATPKPFTQAYALYGVYSHVFVGAVESYNEVRQGLHFGLGGFAASGYLAPAGRVGWDVYMGRRFTTSFAANYVGPSSILVGGETVKTKGGAGGDVIVSLNY